MDKSEFQLIADSLYPKVVLENLPREVRDVLFADPLENGDSQSRVSGTLTFHGKIVKIDNSFKLKKFSNSYPWIPVLPNLQSDDSGFGTEDGSYCSKDDKTEKRAKRWKGADEKGEYEVEKVVDHRFDKDGKDQFFVKWVGWGSQFNTWEPLSNLNCEENLNNYIKKMILDILFDKWRQVPSCKTIMMKGYRSAVDHLIKNTPKKLYLKKLAGGFKQRGLAVSTLVKQLEDAVLTKCPQRRASTVEEIKEHCALLRLLEVRKEQLNVLKLWENRLNSDGPGGLTVENDFDLEGPPRDFTYITQNTTGPGVNGCILMGHVAGCECIEECGTKGTCCPNMAGVDWAYSADGRLTVSPRSGIFECNRYCACGSECPNRVVQSGRKVKLCIFRTANGRGWGLKAGERIEKGSFLTTYLGEIITSEEAAKRDENYEKTGLSYLFDLDMMDPEEAPVYTIDAMKCGNESHFINHSCNPNAHVAGVWIETNDPAIPLLAVFAKRTIRKGEEITFNYQGGDLDNRMIGQDVILDKVDEKSTALAEPKKRGKRTAKKCKCGTKACKGFYF